MAEHGQDHINDKGRQKDQGRSQQDSGDDGQVDVIGNDFHGGTENHDGSHHAEQWKTSRYFFFPDGSEKNCADKDSDDKP